MQKKFYISTPIYYASGKPHIGHAYTTILADVIKGYKKLLSYDCCFVTGMDEHGQKIFQKAKQQNLTPQQFVDIQCNYFLDLWKKLNIDYDCFIRTTNQKHCETVSEIFDYYLKNDLIYSGNWTGFYCVECEENKTNSQINKKDDEYFCDIGHKLELKNEKSYFYKIKNSQEWLLNFFNSNNNFIFPEHRKKELINNFINDLEDLSVSRQNIDWGIKINNSDQTIYVWLDALFSYLTAINFDFKNQSNQNYLKYWNNDDVQRVHLMSKEITRFHCIYWPIFLKDLNLKLPSKIISHGWIVTKEGKMSKSLGNIIDPNEIINLYGSDALRYFLMKEILIQNDGIFNNEIFLNLYNADLSNNIGNLVSRTIGMIKKYNNNICPSFKSSNTDIDKLIQQKINLTIENCNNFIENFEINKIIESILELINFTNKLIEDYKPWDLFKQNQIEILNKILNYLLNIIYTVVVYLSPILKDGVKLILNQLNLDIDINIENIKNFNKFDHIKLSDDSFPIYLRK